MKKESISLQPSEKSTNEEKEKLKKQQDLQEKFQRNRGVNFGRLAMGIFFVCFGIYFLAKNTGFLPAEFEVKISIKELWPLLIVFAGLSMLSARSKLSALIGSLITFVILFFVGWLILSNAQSLEKYSRTVEKTPFSFQKSSSTESFLIEVDTSGSSVNFKGIQKPAVEGSLTSNVSELKTSSVKKDQVDIIQITTKGIFDSNLPTKYSNNLDIFTHNNTPVTLNLKGRAVKGNFNFNETLLNKANLSLEASTVNLLFGNKLPETRIDIDAKASNINFSFPKGVGVQIAALSELSLQNLQGLSNQPGESIDKKIYQTDFFEKTSSKIFIQLDSSLSGVRVEWRK